MSTKEEKRHPSSSAAHAHPPTGERAEADEHETRRAEAHPEHIAMIAATLHRRDIDPAASVEMALALFDAAAAAVAKREVAGRRR
jgi:hypothetical protein